MKNMIHFCAALMLTFAGAGAQAMAIITPGDAILGGKLVDEALSGNFVTGSAGFGENQWPGNEGPENLINGVGQKYLNFGKEWSGAIITPSAGPSIVKSITFWTANDWIPRDPDAFFLYGTNAAIDPLVNPLSNFSFITGPFMNLPDSRNPGGNSPLNPANAWTWDGGNLVSNNTAYSSYLIVFDILKDSGSANSMQLAEMQLYGQIVGLPEPGTLVLLIIGLAGLGFSSRKKLV